MNILVTGAAGFVGSSLISSILSTENTKGWNIVGVDNLSYGYRERVSSIMSHNFEFIELDICDPSISTRLEGYSFDIIIHCAAVAPLPECEVDHHKCLTTNVAALGSVYHIASRTKCKRIIHFSSSAVYEGSSTFPTPEDVEIATLLAYPTSKYLSEIYLESLSRSHDTQVFCIRLFNLYGPRQDYFRKQPPLIGYLLKCLINKEVPHLYSDGNQARDYIYIDDLLEIIVKLLAVPYKPRSFEVLNAGSGNPVSVNQIINCLDKIAGSPIVPIRNNAETFWDRYPHIFENDLPLDLAIIKSEVNKHSHSCNAKLFNYIGYHRFRTMEEGLTNCYNFALKNWAEISSAKLGPLND